MSLSDVIIFIYVSVTDKNIFIYVSVNDENIYLSVNHVVFVALLFYVHDKHLRSCRDGQLT